MEFEAKPTLHPEYHDGAYGAGVPVHSVPSYLPFCCGKKKIGQPPTSWDWRGTTNDKKPAKKNKKPPKKWQKNGKKSIKIEKRKYSQT